MRKLFGAFAVLSYVAVSNAATADDAAHLIRIKSSGAIHKTERVAAGRAIAWINESSRIAQVAFQRGDAEHLQCDTKAFRISGDRVESRWLRPTDVLGNCQLAAGEYRYEVSLRAGNTPGETTRVQRTGTIEVF